MSRLTGTDFFTWLALRRVRRGGVAKRNDGFYDRGRPMAGLGATLEALLRDGVLDVDQASPGDGPSRLDLTARGLARYSQLCQRQRPALPTRGTDERGFLEWMALRRIDGSGVVQDHGRYFDNGYPVADDIADALDRLIQDGHLTLGRPRRGCRRTVSLTVAGDLRYTELREGMCHAEP